MFRESVGERTGETDALARLPELDGLRGLAIGQVIIWHYFVLTLSARPHSLLYYVKVPFRLTWTGVDLFFVLSGFLIGGILIRVREATNYYSIFYTRRAFRIIPIYAPYLLLTFGLLAGARAWIGHEIPGINAGQLAGLSYLLFLQNFWMVLSNSMGPVMLSVTWSLAVEEQFYLTFPWVVRTLKGRTLPLFVCCGIVAAPILRTVLHIVWPHRMFAGFVLMPARADALLLGVLGAMAMADGQARTWMKNHRYLFGIALAIGFIGTACLLKYWSGLQDPMMLYVGYTWMAGFYLLLLLAGILWPETIWGRILRIGWLRWLGLISYGTYLLHEVVLGVVFWLFRRQQPSIASVGDAMLTVVSLGLTLFICWISWAYYEQPFIREGRARKYEFVRAK